VLASDEPNQPRVVLAAPLPVTMIEAVDVAGAADVEVAGHNNSDHGAGGLGRIGEGAHFDIGLRADHGGGGVESIVEHGGAREFPGVAKVGVGGGDVAGEGAVESAAVEAKIVAAIIDVRVCAGQNGGGENDPDFIFCE